MKGLRLCGFLAAVFLACFASFAWGKNVAIYEWEDTVYKDKATPEQLEKQPWLFGNGTGLYLLRAHTADEGGPVKQGEKRNLIVAGYYGWNEGDVTWTKDVKYEWRVYNRGKEEVIPGAKGFKYVWTAPAYDPGSEAANTYTVTCWTTVQQKVKDETKEVKEGVSWILWVEAK